MTTAIESPAVGSAVRKYVSDRMKEVAGWQALDSFLKEVGDIDAHLAGKRRMVDEAEREAAEARARATAARKEADQMAADAAVEAEEIRQRATALMDDAEAVKAEADDVLTQARKTARKIVRDADAQVARVLSSIKGMNQ